MNIQKIDQFEKVVFFGAKILGVFANSAQDGKASLTDLKYLKDLLEPISVIGEINLEELKLEFASLTEEEIRVLVERFKDHFDIENKTIEAWLEETVNAVMEIYFAIRNLSGVQAKYLKPSE